MAATRWPDRETVTDQSQGVKLAKIQELVRCWGTDYDWRKVEAKLNALPQFMTMIDGLGIHVNMPATVPEDLMKSILAGDPAPAGLSAKEKAAFESLSTFFGKNAGYGAMMVTRPQTVGYGLSDSPVGLAAWHYDKFAQWTHSGGEPERSLTKDEMLDDIMMYWLTNSAISSARLYWENNNNNFSAASQRTAEIKVLVAVTVFPGEIYRAPKSWTKKAYPKLIYFNEVDKGGHFAAWEQPQLFSEEIRAAFRSLR